MNPRRTFDTVRHLRAVQVTDRFWRPVRRWRAGRVGTPSGVTLRPGPPVYPVYVHAQGDPRSELEAVGQTHRLEEGEARWNPKEPSRLWTYHLHYLQILHALPRDAGHALLEDWIDGNPGARGPGWEPYPLSLRIREWIEWLVTGVQEGEETDPPLLESVLRQVEALRVQVEHHLQGNHLLENAVTLCWAGLALDGDTAKKWQGEGWRLLERELGRQVKGDGTHEERSPMYQALLAESLLRLGRVAERCPRDEARRLEDRCLEVGEQLVATLRFLTHPGGDLALFQDTALGVAPTPEALVEAFDLSPTLLDVPPGPWHLPDAAYLGWRGGKDTALILDAGAPSPAHQPGHAHAGALSFELSHRGHRLFTDTGILTYDVGKARARDRSTTAHNTIEVDGQDQSEMWGAFRCGRRIRMTETRLQEDGEMVLAYRGPAKSGGRVHHQRSVKIETTAKATTLRIEDEVEAQGRHTLVSRLHLGPTCRVRRVDDGFDVTVEGAVIARILVGGDWQIGSSPYHPNYGSEVRRPCLVLRESFDARWQHGMTVLLL